MAPGRIDLSAPSFFRNRRVRNTLPRAFSAASKAILPRQVPPFQDDATPARSTSGIHATLRKRTALRSRPPLRQEGKSPGIFHAERENRASQAKRREKTKKATHCGTRSPFFSQVVLFQQACTLVPPSGWQEDFRGDEGRSRQLQSSEKQLAEACGNRTHRSRRVPTPDRFEVCTRHQPRIASATRPMVAFRPRNVQKTGTTGKEEKAPCFPSARLAKGEKIAASRWVRQEERFPDDGRSP